MKLQSLGLLVAAAALTACSQHFTLPTTEPAISLSNVSLASTFHTQGRYLASELSGIPKRTRHTVTAQERVTAVTVSVGRGTSSISGVDVTEIDVLDTSPDTQGTTGLEFIYTDGSAILGSTVDGNTIRQDNPDGSYALTRFDARSAADGNVAVNATAVSIPAGTQPASYRRSASSSRRSEGVACNAAGVVAAGIAIPIARAVFKRVGATIGAIVLGSEFPPGAIIGFVAGQAAGDWFGSRIAGPLIGVGVAAMCNAIKTPIPTPSPEPSAGGSPGGGKRTVGDP